MALPELPIGFVVNHLLLRLWYDAGALEMMVNSENGGQR